MGTVEQGAFAERASRRAARGEPPRADGRAASVGDIFVARLGELERRVQQELERSAGRSGPVGAFALDLVRELVRSGSSMAGTVAGANGLAGLVASWSAGAPVDELGLDAELSETVREIVRPLARRWLGVRESKSAALPGKGPVLVVMNRSGWPLPIEPVVLSAFLCDGRLGDRRLVVLWDRDPAELPFASDFLRRIGVVAATAANATALLERGAVVLAFPEGGAARAKTYDRRYRLARFESAEVLDAALAAGARIVPAAVVGNEESWPLLASVGSVPLTAQFPLLGLLGLLPLPVTWTVRLGASIEYASAGDAAPAADRVADAVRARMQALLGELVAERESILGG